jgi:uncharacterized membrane protein YkvA (DUF1232 family)
MPAIALDVDPMIWFNRFFRHGAAIRLRVHLLAAWKLMRHPQTPRAAKWVAFAVIAYAVSPIDLIPDFIPVLGLLDDLLLLPLGVALVIRLTPPALWQACLLEAEASAERLPRLWWGALLVLAVWLILFALFVAWLLKLLAAA